jgi:orotate phosphoribosyltransferase
MPMKDALRELLVQRALGTGQKVTLSTGRVSNFYFNCKPVTLSSDGASLVADAFLDKLKLLREPVTAVGGRTLGADPIVGAMIMRALERGQRIEGFYVREQQKAHGTKERIANAPPSATKVVIVDDVVTTGGSVIEAIDAAQEAGCIVVGVITLVDRQEESGEARIRARVPHYVALYTRKDFPEIGEPDAWVNVPTLVPKNAGNDLVGEARDLARAEQPRDTPPVTGPTEMNEVLLALRALIEQVRLVLRDGRRLIRRLIALCDTSKRRRRVPMTSSLAPLASVPLVVLRSTTEREQIELNEVVQSLSAEGYQVARRGPQWVVYTEITDRRKSVIGSPQDRRETAAMSERVRSGSLRQRRRDDSGIASAAPMRSRRSASC